MFGNRRAVLPPVPPPPLLRLEQVRLTDSVSRTLFAEYAAHRTSDRGKEETGWALLGLRKGDEAIVLATLPAGAQREAGEAHVRFHRTAQAVASRFVRQIDRRLTLLGIAHTHPGSLRHPSDGDYRGDIRWVEQLRGRDGIFAIGTADAPDHESFATQPRPHQQCQNGLRWSWYALSAGDRHYRPIRAELTIGPDLAQSLRPVWNIIETHAARLERLMQQISGVTLTAVSGGLMVNVPLVDGGAVQALMAEKTVRYYVQRGGETLAADLPEPRVDQGVFLLLAELAAQPPDGETE